MDDLPSGCWPGLWIAGAAVCIMLAIVGVAAVHGSETHVTGYVAGTYVKHGSGNNSGDTYMAIIAKDEAGHRCTEPAACFEVFKDGDSWTYLKWDSSDVWAQLVDAKQRHKHVTLDVTGWRVPFLSEYRNILSVREGG